VKPSDFGAALPAGYGLRGQVDGVTDQFQTEADQKAIYFALGSRGPSQYYPLVVAQAAAPGLVLCGTENQDGADVDLGVPGLTARYHDGWWAIDPTQEGHLTWDTAVVHSLTCWTAGGTIGVRGSRVHGVTLDSLQRLAVIASG
jgi:hypothetical protein